MSRQGDLRASDADRDRIVERLHKAATEGRIAAEELEQRVTTALRARTYGELEQTVADLPARREGRAPVRRSTSGLGSASGWALSAIRANPMLLLFVIPALAVTAAMLLAATIVWSVLMVVFMVVGGHSRRPHPPPPWMYGRQRRSLPRRGPGSYWA